MGFVVIGKSIRKVIFKTFVSCLGCYSLNSNSLSHIIFLSASADIRIGFYISVALPMILL
jgi:hypothetical protein